MQEDNLVLVCVGRGLEAMVVKGWGSVATESVREEPRCHGALPRGQWSSYTPGVIYHHSYMLGCLCLHGPF